VELKLRDRTSKLTGTIRDERGQPVPGLIVSLIYSRGTGPFQITPMLRAVTDANGRYELTGYRAAPVKPAKYTPPAWAPPKLDGLRGKVTDKDGRPVALANVHVFDLGTTMQLLHKGPPVARKSNEDSTFTDLSGEFVCTQIDPAQSLTVIAWDASYEHCGVAVTEPGTKAVELKLGDRTSKLTGTIRDERGQPVAGLIVSLIYSRGTGPFQITQMLRAATDENGRYEIVGYHAAPEGMRHYLAVDSPQPDWSQPPEHEIGTIDKYVHFPVTPGETLSGLDYAILQRDLRIAAPVRDELTHEP
jgi:5-hydroxyisourate hydrolase-like protein (transthyretin family)